MAVTDENIVGLFAALLAERRVLLIASKLSTVRLGQRGRGWGPGLAWSLGTGRRGGFRVLIPQRESRGKVLALPVCKSGLSWILDPPFWGESEWAAL